MSEIYSISETINKYRWVGPVQDANDWGLELVKVRTAPVRENWSPVEIEWLPETINREISDFPNFWSGMLCLSRRAFSSPLRTVLEGSGEFLDLSGLGGEYTAYHCLTIIDATDKEVLIERLKEKFANISVSAFVPPLRKEVTQGVDIFRIKESIVRHFVSPRFKEIYDQQCLTGLDFLPVPLL